MPIRRIAKNFNVDRNTVARFLVENGAYEGDDSNEARRAKVAYDKEKNRARHSEYYASYKDTPYQIVDLDKNKCKTLIEQDLIIPQIADCFSEYTYEQVYDTIFCDEVLNSLYRKHGQLKLTKRGKQTAK